MSVGWPGVELSVYLPHLVSEASSVHSIIRRTYNMKNKNIFDWALLYYEQSKHGEIGV